MHERGSAQIRGRQVRRVFARDRPNEPWLTDITEHPTNEGKVYCCVVLDTFSRLVVGWSVESTQTTVLVLNALGTATQQRGHRDGLIIHSDRGTQFSSWAFSDRVRTTGIAPSMGAVGMAADNAMMESFWRRMQVELLNRRRWKTRIELATAIHDYARKDLAGHKIAANRRYAVSVQSSGFQPARAGNGSPRAWVVMSSLR